MHLLPMGLLLPLLLKNKFYFLVKKAPKMESFLTKMPCFGNFWPKMGQKVFCFLFSFLGNSDWKSLKAADLPLKNPLLKRTRRGVLKDPRGSLHFLLSFFFFGQFGGKGLFWDFKGFFSKWVIFEEKSSKMANFWGGSKMGVFEKRLI